MRIILPALILLSLVMVLAVQPEATRILGPGPLADSPAVTLYFVGAKWCGPCKAMHPTLARLRSQGYKIVEYDYDTPEGRRFATDNQVTNLPTMIFVNAQGGEYHRETGEISEDALINILKGVGFLIRAVIRLIIL